MTSLRDRSSFSEHKTPEQKAEQSATATKPWPTMYDLPSEYPEEPGSPVDPETL